MPPRILPVAVFPLSEIRQVRFHEFLTNKIRTAKNLNGFHARRF